MFKQKEKNRHNIIQQQQLLTSHKSYKIALVTLQKNYSQERGLYNEYRYNYFLHSSAIS